MNPITALKRYFEKSTGGDPIFPLVALFLEPIGIDLPRE